MNSDQIIRSPYAKIAYRLAWISVFISLFPLLAGNILRAIDPLGHSPLGQIPVPLHTSIANVFVFVPATVIAVVAGLIHVIRCESSVPGKGRLLLSLCMVFATGFLEISMYWVMSVAR